MTDPNNPTPISNRLNGQTILITRPADTSAELRSILEAHGAYVLCFPTIEITDPDSWEACDSTIWKLAEYDSVCFTSKNAVEKWIRRIRLVRPQALNTLATRNLYAVGEKTKSTLESFGFSVQPIPSKHTAKDLAQSFYGQNISGKHFLFPKSNIAGGVLSIELRSLGALVDEIVAYKTVLPETEHLEHLRSIFMQRKVGMIIFFSPSSVRNFVEMMGTEMVQNSAIAVIGPTTADAVHDAGLTAAIVAGQQTTESLVQEIVDYYREG